MSTRFGRLIVGVTINPVAPNKPLPFKESVIISQQLRAPPAAIFTSSGCALTCSPPRLFIYSPLLLCLVRVWLASPFFSPARAVLRSDCSTSSLYMELVDLDLVSAKAVINTSTPCMRVWRIGDGRHCACFCWLTRDAPSHLAGKAWHPQIGSSPVRFKSLWRQCVHLEQVCRPPRLTAPRAPLSLLCSPTQGRARDVTPVPLVRAADRSLGRPRRISRWGKKSRNNFVPVCPNFQMFLYFLFEAGAGGFGW